MSALTDFFLPYLEERERELVAREGVRVQFFEYDGTLNDIDADHGAADR